jgi:tRNA threonylcarbamoyladenosine biosynthesis protein TsaE
VPKNLILKNSELNILANFLFKPILTKKIITLSGELGAGKTTLAKEICKVLQVYDEVTSPSYNILNIYESENGPIYHYDLYRIKEKNEIENIAIDDAFSNYITLIEWPELIKDMLPKDNIRIKIRDYANDKREYIIDGI